MNGQINPPELPPMQPAPPAMAPPPPPAAAAPAPKPGMGTKRLRQAIGYLAAGGMTLVLAVCGGQLVLREGLRPTDLMATIEAQTEIGVMNQKLGFARGEHVLTEADYQETIANAQRRGAARAELAFQKQMAAVQADKERVVGAYQTLYQRTGIIAQAGVAMEQQALQFRQQLLASTNGGRAMVLSVEDTFCALGDEDACDAARKLRAGMIDESTKLTEGDLAKKVNELMAGIPDPATLIASEDQRRNGAPAIDRR